MRSVNDWNLKFFVFSLECLNNRLPRFSCMWCLPNRGSNSRGMTGETRIDVGQKFIDRRHRQSRFLRSFSDLLILDRVMQDHAGKAVSKDDFVVKMQTGWVALARL